MESFKGTGDETDQKYIVFWDMVNLYGKAMQARLPVSDFIWLDQGNLTNFQLKENLYKA